MTRAEQNDIIKYHSDLLLYLDKNKDEHWLWNVTE